MDILNAPGPGDKVYGNIFEYMAPDGSNPDNFDEDGRLTLGGLLSGDAFTGDTRTDEYASFLDSIEAPFEPLSKEKMVKMAIESYKEDYLKDKYGDADYRIIKNLHDYTPNQDSTAFDLIELEPELYDSIHNYQNLFDLEFGVDKILDTIEQGHSPNKLTTDTSNALDSIQYDLPAFELEDNFNPSGNENIHNISGVDTTDTFGNPIYQGEDKEDYLSRMFEDRLRRKEQFRERR